MCVYALCLQFIDLGNVMSMGSMMDSEGESEDNLMKPSTSLLTAVGASQAANPPTITVNHTPLTAVSANGTLTLNTANMASMMNPVSTNSGQTITMLTSGSSTQGPTKTIVVVPVSATSGSGDAPQTKKMKML